MTVNELFEARAQLDQDLLALANQMRSRIKTAVDAGLYPDGPSQVTDYATKTSDHIIFLVKPVEVPVVIQKPPVTE